MDLDLSGRGPSELTGDLADWCCCTSLRQIATRAKQDVSSSWRQVPVHEWYEKTDLVLLCLGQATLPLFSKKKVSTSIPTSSLPDCFDERWSSYRAQKTASCEVYNAIDLRKPLTVT
ncbi:hypothetical protein TNCV_1078651 [Trichonephila clavipes]|nr:hypothetical protein TNCV_1078651 [Trichonephila clavipes]